LQVLADLVAAAMVEIIFFMMVDQEVQEHQVKETLEEQEQVITAPTKELQAAAVAPALLAKERQMVIQVAMEETVLLLQFLEHQ
jgi:hypothetical protein